MSDARQAMPTEPPPAAPREASGATAVADPLDAALVAPAPAAEGKAGGDALLEQIVQSHLTQSSQKANPAEGSDAVAKEAGRSLEDEIQSLLKTAAETRQVAAAPAGERAATGVADQPAQPAAEPVNAAELDALLAHPAAATGAGPAAAAPAAVHDELDAHVAAAASVVEDELASLMAQKSGPAAEKQAPAAAPLPAEPAAAAKDAPVAETPVTAAEASALDLAEKPADKPVRTSKLRALIPTFHDVALTLAQLVDLPFGGMAGGAKGLMGLAGGLSLLTGVVLLVLAHRQQ